MITIFRSLCLALLVILVTNPVRAAPEAKLVDPHWQLNNPQSVQVIDHTRWDEFLREYSVESADGIVRIRYGSVTSEDRASLNSYLQDLQTVSVESLHRDVQLAFWVNLYNGVTVNLVLQHYPVETIRDVMPEGWFSRGPWNRPLMQVDGRSLSLNDIEHGILRPLWQDARLHYALNCVSLGCPDIAREAYTPETMERLLEEGARHYINHPRGVRVERGKIVASKIYKWYGADFGNNTAAIIDHFRRYAEPALAEQLRGIRKISQYDYVWLLNDAGQPGTP